MEFDQKCVCGDETKGLAIFCGGIRFFGIPYGISSIPAGLKLAGWRGRVIYWPWHERWSGPAPRPTLPALWDVKLQQKHADKIAAYIADYSQRYPERPVHLLACSAGGGVAMRILEVLSQFDTQNDRPVINSVGLLSAALSPGCDLRKYVDQRVTGKIVNFHSKYDIIILAAGTALFGTADRRRGWACGMRGLRHTNERVYNVPFRLEMVKTGRMGMHNSAMKKHFVEKYVAPELGMADRKIFTDGKNV